MYDRKWQRKRCRECEKKIKFKSKKKERKDDKRASRKWTYFLALLVVYRCSIRWAIRTSSFEKKIKLKWIQKHSGNWCCCCCLCCELHCQLSTTTKCIVSYVSVIEAQNCSVPLNFIQANAHMLFLLFNSHHKIFKMCVHCVYRRECVAAAAVALMHAARAFYFLHVSHLLLLLLFPVFLFAVVFVASFLLIEPIFPNMHSTT